MPFDENGHPLDERVGRQLAGISQYINIMGQENSNMIMQIENIPNLEELKSNGIGFYLKKGE